MIIKTDSEVFTAMKLLLIWHENKFSAKDIGRLDDSGLSMEEKMERFDTQCFYRKRTELIDDILKCNIGEISIDEKEFSIITKCLNDAVASNEFVCVDKEAVQIAVIKDWVDGHCEK